MSLKGDEALGATIVRNILDYPLRCIAENAGHDGAVVANRVSKLEGKNEGFDADKGIYCDLVEAGIIDPAKVVPKCVAECGQCGGTATDDRNPNYGYSRARGGGWRRPP